MAEFLFHLKPAQGYNNVFDPGAAGMSLTRFGILQLAKGTSYSGNTGEWEVAFVLLGGKCAVKGDGFEFKEVGCRKNVFDGKPHTVYLPRRTAYTITGVTDVDIAVNEAPASRNTAKPTVITPEMCGEMTIGRDNFTRLATVMISEKFDSEHVFGGYREGSLLKLPEMICSKIIFKSFRQILLNLPLMSEKFCFFYELPFFFAFDALYLFLTAFYASIYLENDRGKVPEFPASGSERMRSVPFDEKSGTIGINGRPGLPPRLFPAVLAVFASLALPLLKNPLSREN